MKTNLFLFLVLFTGCIAKKNYSITPHPKYSMQENNLKIGIGESNLYTVKASFLNEINNTVSMDLEIINNSDDSIAINPNNFYFKTSNNENKIFARNSNLILANIEKDIDKNNKKLKRQSIVGMLFLATAIATEINDIGKEDKTTSDNSKMLLDANSNSINNTKQQTFVLQNHLINTDQELLQPIILQPIILQPHHFIKGIVKYPKFLKTNQLDFYYPIGNDILINIPFIPTYSK